MTRGSNGRQQQSRGSAGRRTSEVTRRRTSGPPMRPAPRKRARFRRFGAAGRMRRRLAAAMAGFLVLSSGLAFLFFFSAAFVVEDIQVSGAGEELAPRVQELARIPGGRPLARVSQTRVAERVLADLRVEQIEVDRQWPSTVVLAVTPREPALALTVDGLSDATWLADASGVVYDRVEAPSGRLPRAVVASSLNPPDLSEAQVQGLSELLRQRPDPAPLGGELDPPQFTGDHTVVLTVGNLTIEWGEPVDTGKKWAVVEALIGQQSIDPAGDITQTIDVSLPDHPVVTGIPPAGE